MGFQGFGDSGFSNLGGCSFGSTNKNPTQGFGSSVNNGFASFANKGTFGEVNTNAGGFGSFGGGFGSNVSAFGSGFGNNTTGTGFSNISGGIGSSNQANVGFNSSTFGSAPTNTGFGISATPTNTGFGISATPSNTGFGISATPSNTGFGISATPSNTGFGISATPSNTGFGISATPSNTGFGTSAGFMQSTTATGAFGANPSTAVANKYIDSDLGYEVYPQKAVLMSDACWSSSSSFCISYLDGQVDLYKLEIKPDNSITFNMMGKSRSIIRAVLTKSVTIEPILCIAPLADGVYAFGGARGNIFTISAENREDIKGHNGSISGISSSLVNGVSNGCVSVGTDGFVKKWVVSGGLKLEQELNLNIPLRSISIHGNRAIVISRDNRVNFIDIQVMKLISNIYLKSIHMPITSITIDPMSGTMYAGSMGKISILPLSDTGPDLSRPQSTVQAHRKDGYIYPVNTVVAANSGLVISGGGDGSMKINLSEYAPPDNRSRAKGNVNITCKWSIDGLPLPVYRVRLSPLNDFILLLCCEDPTVSILGATPRVSRAFIIDAPDIMKNTPK